MNGENPAVVDRSVPPAREPVRPFEFPDVTSIPLPNGLGLRVAATGRFPLVTFNLVLKDGEASLSDQKAGLAVLTGSALDTGTGRRSGAELAEAFESIGSGLSVHTGWDSTTLSVTCLADRKEEALALLAEAVLEPTFPDDEVERLRNQRLAAIRQRRMDPGRLADDSLVHSIFSDRVPYHRPLAGTRESVEPLGSDALQGHWSLRFRPSGGGLVVVGDIEKSEVEALARSHLGAWAGAPEAASPFQAEPREGGGRIVVVNRPGAVQSEIRVGQVGVSRASPHYFPLLLFNTVLGGAFTSRLMLNLREKRGFTYGVRSRFGFRSKPGPFVVSTAVGTDVTAPAVGEIHAELKGLLDGGPTAEELTQSRDFLAGVFPLQLETTAQVAARIAELLIYDLPDDYFSTYRHRIRSVTREAVLDSGRAVLRPAELVTLVVGDAETIRGPLEELGLGPVEVAGQE